MGNNGITNDLAAFMSLAGDHQNVAGPQTRDACADGLRAVADLGRVGTAFQDFPAYGRSILAAWIVVRDDDMVSLLGRDASITARLVRSRSPPQPNTTDKAPRAWGRRASRMVASASGVWA